MVAMARPREFDEAQALDKAMEVFWRQGYKNTSLDDLLDAMGIQRGSFYNAFGSKKETYVRTLDRYADFMVHGGPYTAAATAEPGIAVLRALFESYVDSVTGKQALRGCFFALVSQEHRGDDPEIQQAVARGLSRMRGVVQRSVEAAQAAGDLPAEVPPEELALLFMSLAWGMHVMAEAGMPREALKQAGAQFFAMSREPA